MCIIILGNIHISTRFTGIWNKNIKFLFNIFLPTFINLNLNSSQNSTRDINRYVKSYILIHSYSSMPLNLEIIIHSDLFEN